MSEHDIIEAMRNNPGGLGSGLTEKQKEQIFLGRDNKPESSAPFDEEKFSKGVETAFKNHPIEWLEMQ